jgi:beta-lactamase regulating signal transducer with metallopeptidase domain
MNTLPGVLDAVFGWCLRASVEGAVVAAVILAGRAALRRRMPGTLAYWLWVVLLLRLVLPWTPESAVSVFNLFPRAQRVAVELPSVGAMLPQAETSALASPPRSLDASPTPEAIEAPRDLPGAAASWSMPRNRPAWGWLAGVAAGLAWPVANAYRFRRRALRSQVMYDARLGELLEECKALMGVSAPVELRACDAVTSPALLGFLRPRLLLPPALTTALGGEELRFIFLHELAHLKRCDILVNWLLTAVQALHWFNPLVWYAFGRMRADREMACDALALSRLGEEEARNYGHTLLRLFEAVTSPRGVPSVAGIAESGSLLKRRIAMIARFRQRSLGWTLAGFGLMLTACATLLTAATPERADSTVAQTPTAAHNEATPAEAQAVEEAVPDAEPRDDFAKRVESFRVGTAKPEEALKVFGEPMLYTSGGQSYSADKLPEHYWMEYDDGFSVIVQNRRVLELRFLNESTYRYKGQVGIGDTLEEAMAVLGPPLKVLDGQPYHAVKDVLYKNANGTPGCAYFRCSAKGVEVMVQEGKVHGLALFEPTRPEAPKKPRTAVAQAARPIPQESAAPAKAEAPTPPTTPAEAQDVQLFSRKIESFPIGRGTVQNLLAVFGRPERMDVDSNASPTGRIGYRRGFAAFVANNVVKELRFEGQGDYRYAGRLGIGSSLDDAVAVLGTPVETITGQPNTYQDNVLYTKVDGVSGDGYYACSAKGVRLFFEKDRVSCMYLTEQFVAPGLTQPSAPLQPAPARPSQPAAPLQPASAPTPAAQPAEAAPVSAATQLHAFEDVRDRDLSKLTFEDGMLPVSTLTFNEKTTWPTTERMGAWKPSLLLQAAKEPGLGIGEVHAQGITGKGVTVAIIDQPLDPAHPEFAGKFEEYQDFGCESHSSMHGPAVTSLLVGNACGTAPGARLYYAAVPSWKKDARYYADALDWLTQVNSGLPEDRKILCVSVSAAPTGPNSPFEIGGERWIKAVVRAERSGMLVIDCTQGHGFVSMCYTDPEAPEDVTRCRPGSRKDGGSGVRGRVCAPNSPRTVAEQTEQGGFGYAYWGQGGLSWSVPYVAGVLALGKEAAPQLSAQQLKSALFESTYSLPDDLSAKIINPVAFVEAVRRK